MVTHKKQEVISVEEYFLLDCGVDTRYEYIDGHAYALAGGTANHSGISVNVVSELRTRLRRGPCRVYNSDMRVSISRTRYVYPDASVSCDERDRGTSDTLQFPRLVIEVLSPGTGSYDRGDKSFYYRDCATIAEYMLIDSQRRAIEVYRRAAPNLWTLHLYGGDDVVELASLQLSIPLESIYEDIVLAEPVEDEP